MQTNLEAVFNQSALFAGLIPEAHVKRFSDCESLSAYADAELCIGMITQGLADIWCVASDGTHTLLTTARQGDCIGIAYVFGDRMDMQTKVLARGRCEAAFIRKDVFHALLEQDTGFAARYLTLCNEKLRFLLGRISLLTAQSCRTRLAAYLLLNRNTEDFVPLHGTKDQLASRLAVSRAAVYRELNELQSRGAITLTKHGAAILDPSLLEGLLYDEKPAEKPKEKPEP